MRDSFGTIVAALMLTGCGQRDGQVEGQVPAAPVQAPVPQPQPHPAPPRTSLPEPKGPIDPKSVEAAGQVVQSYGALVEQKRWSEAAALWGSPDVAATMQSDLERNSAVHLEVGDLGEPEGAAGSIYVTMPVSFYGEDKSGKSFRRPAEVILRRVNDVDGSTEAQRRWHIERIEWGAPKES